MASNLPNIANIMEKPPNMAGMAGMGGMGRMGGMSASNLLSGGMPCKFELPMEFICTFLFTFIIYFCVFAFIPYNGIIEKILGYIKKITDTFIKFLYTLIPSPVKKAASKIFPSFITKFFKETLPKLIKRKKEEVTTTLQKKLQKIKEETEKKINAKKKSMKNNKDFISKTNLYLNEQYLKIKEKILTLWEKFKDKILPAIIISVIYYVIWLVFFKLIPTILKYLINVAQQFKQQ